MYYLAQSSTLTSGVPVETTIRHSFTLPALSTVCSEVISIEILHVTGLSFTFIFNSWVYPCSRIVHPDFPLKTLQLQHWAPMEHPKRLKLFMVCKNEQICLTFLKKDSRFAYAGHTGISPPVLLREVLYAFQGIQGQVFYWDATNDNLILKPNVRFILVLG